MPLFSTYGSISKLKEIPFEQEREMQKVVEKNLQEMFGLQFVSSEFSPHNKLRIDTLAYDPEQKSFVIIEFKRGSSWSVVDQGFAYLSLLLNNKADFILKYQKCGGKNCDIDDINWEASRVMFVASSFNVYQTEALGFRDMPFELWEVRRYEKNILAANQLQSSAKAKLTEANLSTEVQKVRREVKQYSVEDHFKEGWDEVHDLYDALIPQLLNLDSRLQVHPVKHYIGLHIDGRRTLTYHIFKSKIELTFLRTRPKDLKDPEGRVHYVKGSMKYYGHHESTFALESETDIPYALMLAKQVLKRYE